MRPSDLRAQMEKTRKQHAQPHQQLATPRLGIIGSLLPSYLPPDNAATIWSFDEDIILHTPSERRVGLCLIPGNGRVLKLKQRRWEEQSQRTSQDRRKENSSNRSAHTSTWTVGFCASWEIHLLIEPQLLCSDRNMEASAYEAFSTKAHALSPTSSTRS